MIPAVQYLQARRARNKVRRAFAALFERVDLLVLPATSAEAPMLEAAVSGGWESMRERIRLLAPFNVAGLPAVSVPCGFTASGLPVGLQIAGPPWADRTVLALARAFEQATGFRAFRPPVSAVEQPSR
jgi:aspartyl-tRNA(Asn)/glutamyl-tRNA(Gln) amidotransferase subunit A